MKGPVVSIKCNFTLAQFLFIQFVCVKVFENHADGKDLVGSDTKKQFHFISGNRGPGIEMVIALLLSAMIVPHSYIAPPALQRVLLSSKLRLFCAQTLKLNL